MKTARLVAAALPGAPEFRALLQERFRAAARRNSRYSLRSFARQLGVDHSTLSQVLRGTRTLTARMVETIGRRIGLPADVVRAHAQALRKKPRLRDHAPLHNRRFDLDTFQLLSLWHHAAILELVHVRGFKADTRWIAGSLGLSVSEVNVAVQRLLRLRLLEMRSPNRWKDLSGDAEFESASMTEALSDQRAMEIQLLAIDAAKRIPTRERAHGQMLLALDSRALGRYRSLLGAFLSDVRALAAESAARDDVYAVEVSLFPVTTLKQGGRKRHG